MQWQNYYIQGEICSVLELSELDGDELVHCRDQYRHIRNVELSLSDLELLRLFDQVEILVITGGLPTSEGMSILYSCNCLKKLVLFYEETDSDEEGIELSKFKSLSYVLSLSNLNIRNLEKTALDIPVETVNLYCAGKCTRRKYVGCNSPIQIPHSVFLSSETEIPAGYLLNPILREFQKVMDSKMRSGRYSANLDTIAIIPICMSKRLLLDGFGKERKYVSVNKRYADIRLQIDYDQLLSADWEGRVALCRECIQKSGEYIKERDRTFCMDNFMEDLSYVVNGLLKTLRFGSFE